MIIILIHILFVGLSKDQYLDINGTAFGKILRGHPFTYTTQGRSVTQELSVLADDQKFHLTSRVMTLKGPLTVKVSGIH